MGKAAVNPFWGEISGKWRWMNNYGDNQWLNPIFGGKSCVFSPLKPHFSHRKTQSTLRSIGGDQGEMPSFWWWENHLCIGRSGSTTTEETGMDIWAEKGRKMVRHWWQIHPWKTYFADHVDEDDMGKQMLQERPIWGQHTIRVMRSFFTNKIAITVGNLWKGQKNERPMIQERLVVGQSVHPKVRDGNKKKCWNHLGGLG